MFDFLLASFGLDKVPDSSGIQSQYDMDVEHYGNQHMDADQDPEI